MPHKNDTVQRLAVLIVVVVVALNVYWGLLLLFGPAQLNPALVAMGLFLQAGGIAGILGKIPNTLEKLVPSGLFVFAILFGAGVEWFGLFHGNETGRVSPSIWAPSK